MLTMTSAMSRGEIPSVAAFFSIEGKMSSSSRLPIVMEVVIVSPALLISAMLPVFEENSNASEVGVEDFIKLRCPSELMRVVLRIAWFFQRSECDRVERVKQHRCYDRYLYTGHLTSPYRYHQEPKRDQDKTT